MKIGDLVNFHATAALLEYTNERYANPGIVIDATGTTKPVYTVLWSDGNITYETLCYLVIAKEKSNDEA